MELLEDIQQQVKDAMRAGESERAGLLRYLVAQIKNEEIANRGKGDPKAQGARAGELSDKDVQAVLRKEAKKRKEAISLYQEGGREDLEQQEKQELEWIEKLLPPAPSEEEIKEVVQSLVDEGTTEFGSLMGQAMGRLEGADGSDVSRIVKEILG